MQLLGQHPNIVALHAVVEDKDNVYLIMQLCCGGELFGHILSQGRLSERQARGYFKSMLTAVNACHTQGIAVNVAAAVSLLDARNSCAVYTSYLAQMQAYGNAGIVHGDIKPEQFLIAHKDGKAVVTLADFGLSVPFISCSAVHDAVGTPLYAAPELMDGSDLSYSCKVDIWSLGVTLYALMCGGLTPFCARAGGSSRIHCPKQYSLHQADINFACTLSPTLDGQLPETLSSALRNQQLLFKFLHPALLLQSQAGSWWSVYLSACLWS